MRLKYDLGASISVARVVLSHFFTSYLCIQYSTYKFNLEHVGKVIRDLMFDTYQPLYLRDPGVYVLLDDDIRQDAPKQNEAYDDTGDDDSYTDGEDLDENDTGATPRVDPFSLQEGLASFGNAMMPASESIPQSFYCRTSCHAESSNAVDGVVDRDRLK